MQHIQYSDSTKTKIVAVFSGPQDPDAYPNQAEVVDDDPLLLAFLNPAKSLRHAAQDELDVVTGARGTIIRCVAAGVAVPAEWSTYVAALRSIANGTDTASAALPTRPAYPAGT